MRNPRNFEFSCQRIYFRKGPENKRRDIWRSQPAKIRNPKPNLTDFSQIPKKFEYLLRVSRPRSIPDGIDLPLFAALRRGVIVLGIGLGAAGVQRRGIRGRFGQFEDELEFFLAAFPVGNAVVVVVVFVLVGIVRVGVAASRSTERSVGGGVGRGSPVIGVGMRGRGGIKILAVL